MKPMTLSQHSNSDPHTKRFTLQSWPYWIGLLLICITTYISVIYSQKHFSVDSDLNHLVKQNAPWRDNLDKTTKAFGDSESSLVVVVSGDDRQQVQQITESLTNDFSKQPSFKDVFAPSTLPWLKQQALWFLSDQEFKSFTQNLTSLMPRLQRASMSQSQIDPDLSAQQLLAQLNQAIESKDDNAARLLIQALNQVADSTQPVNHQQDTTTQGVNWFSLLFPEDKHTSYQIISINAEPDRSQKEPNRFIMETAQNIIRQYNDVSSVQIRLTGQTALDFDEIKDANHSVKLAGTMSLIGLIVVLGFGIRSLRIIAASYVAVIVGLVWTLALGLWLVGNYNTISIVFLVMFIGLGVDFSIHFCLRIREEQGLHANNQATLLTSIRETLTPLSLCALTSAIGFLGFYPTAYTGLAELGIISAAGMLMGLVATFSVIPVFFFLFGYPRKKQQVVEQEHSDEGYWLVEHHRLVIGIAVMLLIVAGIGASQMKFDFSTLVLKSPRSESVNTLEEIQQQGLTSSYQMMMLAKTPAQAQQWQQQLAKLPEVSNALSINSFLPQDRNSKLVTLSQSIDRPASPEAKSITPIQLAQNLETSPYKDALSSHTLNWLKTAKEPEIYQAISLQALQPLAQMQQGFMQMMQASPATLDDIPTQLAQRYYNQDYALVVAYPSGDMRDVKQLNRFIDAVQAVAPNATGRPVAEQQVGKIITQAFIQATCYSLALIALVLLFALKHKRDVVLSFIPLLLTTLSTMAVAHWSGFSLNMANIIVIPLIFGLGVDNGIHIVERFREVGSVKAFYSSSTPKAAILSSLTTIVTFGSLLLADHRGMFSIGFLLTIAIGFLLIYSLTVLPALLFSVKKNNE
ncbi:MMPL family transporter [Vibrio algivorus]|uniref:MMPL family transporter n=1 Tax=Vibrio algivorus TaxID=1667024 RepID=A0A557P772_9VIBR|nr:MMPL family transporter [Vibrio algivorus]TVO36500.1 MMPL family transporter [Vibrio algivorus]